jgi:hypothetical protein
MNRSNAPEADRRATAGPPTYQIQLSRPVLLTLLGLLIVPWLVVTAAFIWTRTARPPAGPAPAVATRPAPMPTGRTFYSHPGPWGDLEYVRIAIEPPEEFISLDSPDAGPPRWFFRNATREQLLELFRSVDLSGSQMAALLESARWEQAADGWWVAPGSDLVLGLSPPARQRIYSVLAQFPENVPQRTAFAFNPVFIDERFERSGLSPQTVERCRSLLYPHSSILLFADLGVVLSTLSDPAEKVQLVKAVQRKGTLLAKLRVDPDSDIEKLVTYWGIEGRAKDLRPLLESLARVPGGAAIDIVHLLPGFARRRIYTYPFPANNPTAVNQDCHWTSLNFFRDQPDDRFAEQGHVERVIESDYYQIFSNARLGDLVFLFRPDGQAVHSAVYLADEIVFTKNGTQEVAPWILMKINDLLEQYSAWHPPNEPLRVVFYRRKDS